MKIIRCNNIILSSQKRRWLHKSHVCFSVICSFYIIYLTKCHRKSRLIRPHTKGSFSCTLTVSRYEKHFALKGGRRFLVSRLKFKTVNLTVEVLVGRSMEICWRHSLVILAVEIPPLCVTCTSRPHDAAVLLFPSNGPENRVRTKRSILSSNTQVKIELFPDSYTAGKKVSTLVLAFKACDPNHINIFRNQKKHSSLVLISCPVQKKCFAPFSQILTGLLKY